MGSCHTHNMHTIFQIFMKKLAKKKKNLKFYLATTVYMVIKHHPGIRENSLLSVYLLLLFIGQSTLLLGSCGSLLTSLLSCTDSKMDSQHLLWALFSQALLLHNYNQLWFCLVVRGGLHQHYRQKGFSIFMTWLIKKC